MNESPNKKAVLVGLFVILGIVFLLAAVLMIGNIHETFKNKMKVVTLFDDVNGLQPGNNIWFSGVKIGTVSKIHFYSQSKVEVSMKIEVKAQQYIHKDAKVKISTDGLIGNKILVIYGGSANSQEVQEGDTLGVEKTFSSEDMMNTLQENNKNLLDITTNFKTISKNIVNGEGTIGKLLTDNSIYTNINVATESLQRTSLNAEKLVTSLSNFTSGLNKKGTLANELTTDTVVFNSIKKSVTQMQKIADTAMVFMTNLKNTTNNSNTPIGILLYDKEAGSNLKVTFKNLEASSKKLDEDLEAVQHNFLLKKYFKKKANSSK